MPRQISSCAEKVSPAIFSQQSEKSSANNLQPLFAITFKNSIGIRYLLDRYCFTYLLTLSPPCGKIKEPNFIAVGVYGGHWKVDLEL
jgi:hypothetical protein